MSNSTNTTADDAIPKVQKVNNGNGDFVGYACQRTITNNIVNDEEITFYVDVAYPPDEKDLALTHVQQALVEAVSARYGISTGNRCESPPFDGTSWVVQFISDANDYAKVDVFGKFQLSMV